MGELPIAIITVLSIFQPLFSASVWKNAQQLLLGAIICPRQRTVTAILKTLGLSNEKRFDNFHWVLNGAKWSPFVASKFLLSLLIKTFIRSNSIEIIVDETIEKRKGQKIKWLGFYRDGSASTKHNKVCRFGLRWLVFTILVKLPWCKRRWALPFLSILQPPRKALKNSKNSTDDNPKIKRKTCIQYTCQVVSLLRKWLGDDLKISLIADGAFACFDLSDQCKKNNITFISRLRWDAALYDFPPEIKKGRPRVKGEKLAKPEVLLNDELQNWSKLNVLWYSQNQIEIEYLTGKCIWYRAGHPTIPVQWIIIRDPKGVYEPAIIYSTNLEEQIKVIIEAFVERFNIEVTFQESNAQLGFGTQRQWSNKAIDRTTPCILALYSIVTVLAVEILKEKEEEMPITKTSWYQKKEATFSDVMNLVKTELWRSRIFLLSNKKADSEENGFENILALLRECC